MTTPYGVAGCQCRRDGLADDGIDEWTLNPHCPYHGILPRNRTDTGTYRVVDIDPGSVERNIRKGEEWIAQRRTPDDAYAALHDAGCNHQSCDHVWDPRDGRIKTYEEARRDDTSPTVSQGDDRVIVDVDAGGNVTTNRKFVQRCSGCLHGDGNTVGGVVMRHSYDDRCNERAVHVGTGRDVGTCEDDTDAPCKTCGKPWRKDCHSAFWDDLAEDMKDPEFRKTFEESLAEMRRGELHPARTFNEEPWWTRLRIRLRWAKEALFDDVG